MKKLIMLGFALCLSLTLAAQYSTINGVIVGSKKVNLYKILNGRLVEIGSAMPNDKGEFGFRFVPEYKGLYVIGEGSPVQYDRLQRFYFKGNDVLQVHIGKDSYELIGKNTKENKALEIWDKKSLLIRKKATILGYQTIYEDFFPEVEAMKADLPVIKKMAKTGNAAFDQVFSDVVDTDFSYYAISYLFMPHLKHPTKEEYTPYYREFNADQYLKAQLLDMPYGDRFLTDLVYMKLDKQSNPDFDQQVLAIPVDVLKGQFVLKRLERAKSFNAYHMMNDKYKQFFVLPEQKERSAAIEVLVADTREGSPAIRFSFPDSNGKNVGLDDLKGKIVVLDLWATWCGPCRAQEPHWESLNEDYKDKQVAFVGISVDKDKPKWETYVKENALKGIQLHAGLNDPISAAYNVKGIPRYIVIGKTGNIITSDAPRPSDKRLRELLDTWLVK